MRRRLCAVVALLLSAVLTLASPASAHRGHGSCAAGAHAFTVENAQNGDFGHFVSGEVKGEGGGETSEQLHAAGCESRP